MAGVVPGFGSGTRGVVGIAGSTPTGGSITPPRPFGDRGPGFTASGRVGPAGGGPGAASRCCVGPDCAEAGPRGPPISRIAMAPRTALRERRQGSDVRRAIIIGHAAPVGRIGPGHLAAGVARRALQLLAPNVHTIAAQARVVVEPLPG